MKTNKMSLANIQGKLSRAEMKNIMAGSEGGTSCSEECPDGLQSCSSSTGVCSRHKNELNIVDSITCDSNTYNC
ncbi:MAG: hypothetical protein ABI091_25120 [Ferruginibacter sp.]